MTSLVLAFALLTQSDSIELRIVSNATTIQVYDYLLVKAAVTNHAEKRSRAPKPSIVIFEKRKDDQWMPLESNDPRWGFEPIDIPSEIFEPGRISVSYWELIGNGTKEGFHFRTPGKYEIRARIKGKEHQLQSNSLFIEVVDRPADETELIIEEMETIYSYLGFRDLSNGKALAKHEPLKRLKGGSIRQTVDRVLKTARYMKSKEIDGMKLSPSAAFPLLVKGMDRVERDYALFHLCAYCENEKDWKELLKLRALLLEDSTIRRQIDVRLRHHGLMKPLPREEVR